MGHEYCAVVEETRSEVTTIRPGQFVIGSFFASDNTCPHCRASCQTSCQHREFVGGAQAELLPLPLADGTLVPTPGQPSEGLLPSLLALSDVMGTGWFAGVAANVCCASLRMSVAASLTMSSQIGHSGHVRGGRCS
jgi:threonine dehydrogenase-like Zn-dependent dehydrogenase